MKAVGWAIAALGAIYIFIAFNMDVSVSTPSTYVPGYGSIGGGDVANLDLMARRQNHLIVASLITLIGALMGIFGKSLEAERVSVEQPQPALPATFEGDRDLAHDAYRLWLAKTYEISRNDIFERFVVGERTFGSLDDALAFAQSMEREKILAAEKAEQERAAAREAYDAQIVEYRERNQAEWDELKPKLVAGGIVGLAAIVGAYFMLREAPAERQARLAREAAEEAALITEAEERFGVDFPEEMQAFKSREVGEDWSFLCSDAKDATLAEFETDLDSDAIKNRFAESLGDGRSEYEYSEDSGNWLWDHEGKRYTLTIFEGEGRSEVNFCMSQAE